MRSFLLILIAAGCAAAESHPSWWGYASPDATALVGIRWETLKGSVFAAPIEAEFSTSLAFPDLAILRDARQILISSPGTIAMFTGSFPIAALRAQAASKGLKLSSYKGTELWIAPGKTLSLAVVNEALLLVGSRKTLEAAIDRTALETGTGGRRYSPLLARGARWAGSDLWVVASRLPDPLANLFVPLEAEARGFDGGVSVRDGVVLEATLDAGSEENAASIADNLRQTLPSLPEVARGLKVEAQADRVLLDLEVGRAQLIASMKGSPAPAPAPVAAPAPVEPPKPVPVPSGPQVIRIYGLDEGTREIVLPPQKPEKQ